MQLSKEKKETTASAGNKAGQIIFTFKPKTGTSSKVKEEVEGQEKRNAKKNPVRKEGQMKGRSPDLKKIPRKSKPRVSAKAGLPEEGFCERPTCRDLKIEAKGGKKRKRGPSTKPIDSYSYCLRKARLSIYRIKREELLLSAYQSNGWNGSSRDKVKPTAELERALQQIEKSKLALRECLQYCEDAHGHIPIPKDKFDALGEPMFEAIACSKCGGLDSGPGNDILICDGGCRRAYHEKCLDPPVVAALIPEDQEWLCPSCTCKDEIISILNEAFDVSYKLNDEIMELMPQTEVSMGATSNQTLGILAMEFPSDEEDDADFSVKDDDVDGESALGDSHGNSSNTYSGHVVEDGKNTSTYTSRPSSEAHDRSEQKEAPGAEVLEACTSTVGASAREQYSQESMNSTCKRRRIAVDYKALNEVMFGSGVYVCHDEEEDDDEEYIPGWQRKKTCGKV